MSNVFERFLDASGAQVMKMVSALHERHNEAEPTGVNFSLEERRAKWIRLIRRCTDLAVNEADPYGNGDQSRISARMPGDTGQGLIDVWGSGGDFNPLSPYLSQSEFSTLCYIGSLELVQEAIETVRKTDGEKGVNQLIEKRESLLRMNALLTTIAGSRAMGTDTFPSFAEHAANHLGIVKFLVEQCAADLKCKDVAGYSVLHHCCTCLANPYSLEIGKYLIDQGVNPNELNRAGRVPLLEPIMSNRFDIVEFLINYANADPTIKDPDGITPLSLARMFPAMTALFSQQIKRQAFLKQRVRLHGLTEKNGMGTLNGRIGLVLKYDAPRERFHVRLDDTDDDKCKARIVSIKQENLEMTGANHLCAANDCSNVGDKMCQRCRHVHYCSKECQKKHWRKHRQVCSEHETPTTVIIPTRPDIANNPTIIAQWGANDDQLQTDQCRLKDNTKNLSKTDRDKMIVKVQIALDNPVKSNTSNRSPGPMLIYNQNRTYQTFIDNQHSQYQQIMKMIKNKGVHGNKGYFNAFVNAKDKVEIDVQNILAPQPW